jgi:probable phosphomutase (TIGR03848 family)
MPTVLLVRHGETDFVKKQRLAGRLPGARLNAKGRAQAAALAEALRALPLKAIYSSPLERTMETAQAIAGLHRLRVKPRPGLIETDLGSWQGASLARLRRSKEWKVLQETPSRFRFPGGEWVVENQARLVADLEAICKLHKPKELIACVGHADPIKLLISHYLGLPLDQFQRIMIDTASVSALHLGQGKAQLLNLNWKAGGFGSKPV